MAPVALNVRSPVLALKLPPPPGAMTVPASRLTALPEPLTALLSVREMEVPAVMSRLPAAVSALLATLAPASLTLRSILPAALNLMAPEVTVLSPVVEATRMSRPDATVIAGVVSLSPALVV